jgi:hypothetical protein
MALSECFRMRGNDAWTAHTTPWGRGNIYLKRSPLQILDGQEFTPEDRAAAFVAQMARRASPPDPPDAQHGTPLKVASLRSLHFAEPLPDVDSRPLHGPSHLPLQPRTALLGAVLHGVLPPPLARAHEQLGLTGMAVYDKEAIRRFKRR